jgi:hypothetical protein
MRVTNTNSNRYTAVTPDDYSLAALRGDAIRSATNRLVAREYGSDHIAHRAVGWLDIGNEFTATILRIVGDLAEDIDKVEFAVSD